MLVLASAPARATEVPFSLKEDFEHGAERWSPTDPKAWKLIEIDGGHAYSLHQNSKYKPPHRSPLNFALLKDVTLGECSLDARVRSTTKDYGHRDICLVFGYQDPAHFYYVHLGKKTDDHANQIFIVDGAARKKISTKTTPGTNWDDAWHQVRVTRNVSEGTIHIYFDDMETPVMTAVDKTFAWGQVGIGTFDDLADYDEVAVQGRRVPRPATK
jgi:hypothetical protein